MTLRLYNTLTRTKEAFAPLDPKNVRMYVCGPTVYDYAHIGNARPVIVFDVLFRLLRHIYGDSHITYVRNITDIDDKINARAAERAKGRNVPILDVVREITEETGRIYEEDIAALGNLKPTHTPRATEHVKPMIAMIAALVAGGHAYEVEGHVLFDVSSKPDYGKLSRRPLDDMIAGARIEVAPYKKNAMDFVLWKPSGVQTPGWDSPWGRGRPGWHIECSAMSAEYLGETFDIHGGGIDLVFPHHENEIAQSEGTHHNHPFAKVWMHNGFLQVEGEKMSKSLGNFVTISELLRSEKFGGKKWDGLIMRLAMLMSHYRQPIDWTLDRLQEAHFRLIKWLGPASARGIPERGKVLTDVIHSLMDDLNTIEAFAALDRHSEQVRDPKQPDPKNLANDIAATLLWLGIARDDDFAEARAESEDLRATIRAAQVGLSKDAIEQRINDRTLAKEQKNFKESDHIRDELLAQGIMLKDNPDGTTSWEVKR